MDAQHNLRGPHFLREELRRQCADLLEFMDSGDIGLGDVAQFTVARPVLSEALLGLANSPLVAPPRRVTSANHAVLMLGLNRIRTFALRFAPAGQAFQPDALAGQALQPDKLTS